MPTHTPKPTSPSPRPVDPPRFPTWNPRPTPRPQGPAPGAVPPTHRLIDDTLRHLPPVPEAPPWSHRLLPATVRGLLADLGWWNNPIPQRPSGHLEQTLAVLRKYGWTQSLDTDLTGRMCIRGAQNLLEKTGHVTPQARAKAVHYLQKSLQEAGITMQFFAWNDLPGQTFDTVEKCLVRAIHLARQKGE